MHLRDLLLMYNCMKNRMLSLRLKLHDTSMVTSTIITKLGPSLVIIDCTSIIARLATGSERLYKSVYTTGAAIAIYLQLDLQS